MPLPTMSTLHICPLEDVDQVIARHRPSHVVSLVHLRDGRALPAGLQGTQALHLQIDDIETPQAGCIYPDAAHMRTLLDFMQRWPGDADILIHCWQGISRSVAAGLILLAMRSPGQEQAEAARLHAAMPFARPNKRLLALADQALDRQGRLVEMARCFQPDTWVDSGRHSQIPLAEAPDG
jgi:predicted protein tyrosine phosphatase